MKNLKSVLTDEGFRRLEMGHPWLFARHLKENAGLPKVPCCLPLGEHWFFLSPKSAIRLRRLGPPDRLWPDPNIIRAPIVQLEEFAKLFGEVLIAHFAAVLREKQKLLNGEKTLRWLFSENDLIPGLVVDLFDESVAVAQIQTAPMLHFWPVMRRLLSQAIGQEITILERYNEALKQETDQSVEDFLEPAEAEMLLNWNGLRWKTRPGSRQKTGAYLDQKENHLTARSWAEKLQLKSAWDVFCYQGGFGMHLAKAGMEVISVDGSETAISDLNANLQLNNLDKSVRTLHMDAFEFLQTRAREKTKVDMVVLDPPPFARTKAEVSGALRGLRELHVRALSCINPGGLLVTCACSHHIGRGEFLNMLSRAAHDTRRNLRILETCGPSADHSPIVSLKETTYLQAWFLKVF